MISSFTKMLLVRLSFLLFLLAFLGCKREEKAVVEILPVSGEIQVLNSCGISGAAAKVRDYLREKGFDVVEVGDDRLWNYEETVIALRNPHWAGAEPLARALQTENIIPLRNKRKLVDATVFIGKDFHKLFEQGKP